MWFLHEQGRRQRLVLDDAGAEVLDLGWTAPASRPYESWHFANPHGQTVHGFFVTPDDSGGPFPVLMFVHGGPTWFDLDRWQPEVQAYVDAGFVVGMVNYRGSVGYGREWRDALVGNIGGPELEDVNAGLADLVARGIADPSVRWSAGTRGAGTSRSSSSASTRSSGAAASRVCPSATTRPGTRSCRRSCRRTTGHSSAARRPRSCRSSCATGTRSTSPTR